jgi:hypothetical protein
MSGLALRLKIGCETCFGRIDVACHETLTNDQSSGSHSGP